MSEANDYRMRLVDSLTQTDAGDWNRLASGAGGGEVQPFLRHEFLAALEASGCVGGDSGWLPRHLLVEDGAGRLQAAVPLYLKLHSWGEYVFDWAWADAWQQHGGQYYPKLLSAVPFTPVTGPRLLAADARAQTAAADALLGLAEDSGLSSLHVLFPQPAEADLLAERGALRRRGCQFHWINRGWQDFDAFLAALSQPKRKKIRAERRKVDTSGLSIERLSGAQIGAADWAFFERCYAKTYAEHGSSPYLNLDFFERLGAALPGHLVLVIARDGNRPVAASLLVTDAERIYGRYWGALVHVPCLHFELCYYQAIELAIERGLAVIEGGAQGAHKMARGFEPVETQSLHWLAEPRFADAVDRFLQREGASMDALFGELDEHSAFRAHRSATRPG
ncbi:MAG: GNAT family N-acetyltransferase [Burkholderiaceae bacterium]